MNYIWWVPSLIVLSLANGISVYRSNMIGGLLHYCIVILCGLAIAIIYSTLVKYSHNLVLDTIIANAIIITITALTVSILSASTAYSYTQWTGMIVILAGVVIAQC